MIGALIGSMVGYKLGQKYLTPDSESPVWTGHVGGDVGKPAISVLAVRHHMQLSYRVYVATEGQWACAASCMHWGEVLAVLQQWEQYIAKGGTVAAWLKHHQGAGIEVRDLEWLFNQPSAAAQ
jgi:hypothetical protein